jgi:hypothetical protein
MDMCSLCGAETQLYHRDVPVCLDCSMSCDRASRAKLAEVQERLGRRLSSGESTSEKRPI